MHVYFIEIVQVNKQIVKRFCDFHLTLRTLRTILVLSICFLPIASA